MLKNRNGAVVDKVTIDAFRSGFLGQTLLPGDAGYDSARRIWNASIDKHPGLIVRCSDLADVVRAVKFSRANNLLVAVKSRPPCFTVHHKRSTKMLSWQRPRPSM
jgi:hypothetical protein